jgi:hypothetical protein
MKKLAVATVAALVLTLLAALPTGARTAVGTTRTARVIPAVETVRTEQGDTVVFDNVRHTAELLPAHSNWVSFKPRRNANGVLACPPAGDYGLARNQATNSVGQTLRWAFYVGFNGDCRAADSAVRFREHLACSGNIASPWCNFESDNAALMYTDCIEIKSCPVEVNGRRDFPAVYHVTGVWFTGAWHWERGGYYMSSDNRFRVHFLNPDNQGTWHKGCSHWVDVLPSVYHAAAACNYAR